MQQQDTAAMTQQLERHENYLASDPGNSALLSSIVDLCLSAGQPERAERHLQVALLGQPEEPYLQAMLGSALLAQRKWDEAATLFGQLLAGHADASLAYNYAFACLWLGRFEDGWQALAPYVAVEAGVPAVPAATLALRLLHRLARLDEAVQLASRCAVAGGHDAAFLGVASAVFFEAGDLEQAAALSAQSLALGRNAEALVTAGSVALAKMDHRRGTELFDAALAINAVEGRAWAGLGMASMLRHDLPAAQAQLEQAVRHSAATHIGTWHLLAWTRLFSGDLAGATAAFEHALRLDRNFGESHGGMAVVQALAGQRAEAEASIARAHGLDKEGMAARFAQMALDGVLQDHERFRSEVMGLLAGRGGPFGRSMVELVGSYAP